MNSVLGKELNSINFFLESIFVGPPLPGFPTFFCWEDGISNHPARGGLFLKGLRRLCFLTLKILARNPFPI